MDFGGKTHTSPARWMVCKVIDVALNKDYFGNILGFKTIRSDSSTTSFPSFNSLAESVIQNNVLLKLCCFASKSN